MCALSPNRICARDGPGAAALRRALCAWHPDIQAGAAIVGGQAANCGVDDDAARSGSGVEALAAAGGVSVIMVGTYAL